MRQINCDSKIEMCVAMGRKHFGKRRKCWLPAFSPFPYMFSKGSFLRVIKKWDCVVKGECLIKQQNFRMNQIQSICRQQNKDNSKIEICVGIGRKHFGKRRKCW